MSMQWDSRTPDKCRVRFNRAHALALGFAVPFVLALLLSAVSTQVTLAVPTSKQVEIWQQKHGYLGPIEVILAPDAIKISEKGKHIVIIAKGPDWKVFVYNKKSKLYYDMTMDVWRKHGLRATWSMMSATSEWPIVKAGDEKILNRNADVFFMTADPSAKAKLRMNKPIDFSYGKAGIYWVDKAACAKERTEVMLQLYRTPRAAKTPLALKTFSKESFGYPGASSATPSKEHILLETTSITKASVPKDTFELPSGYKRARDDRDVTVTKATPDSLDSIFDQMGLKQH